MSKPPSQTLGERLIRLLEAYGVDTVFGIPGVHTVELYRGLAGSPIRHVTPRHEQGAAFMADGYARASGRPGVCFLITGPGLLNAATPMAQALADSAPMLVISGVSAVGDLGRGAGALHALPDQRGVADGVARFSQTIFTPEQLDEAVARAFALFAAARPGPVHLEIPVDVMGMAADAPIAPPAQIGPPVPAPSLVSAAAARLAAAERPVILAGGGVAHGEGPTAVAALAEALGAPVVESVNASGVLGAEHPLVVPASATLAPVRALIAEADAALAVGTELGSTDYDMYRDGGLRFSGALIRLDIDPEQTARNHAADIALVGDAAAGLRAIAEALPLLSSPRSDGAARAAAARSAAWEALDRTSRAGAELVQTVWSSLPGARIVGDSTQPVYAGNYWRPAPAPRRWFNAATGFGALGFAPPAAIGAALADPETPTVCLVGDGGLQFTAPEMATAVDEGVSLIMLVWNNQGYGEIKTSMLAAGVTPEGVDPQPPDLIGLARAMGWRADRLSDLAALPDRLRAAAAEKGATLIEIPEPVALGTVDELG